jgi:glycosyltransferase involved in cell wall biosynthesis
MKQVSVLLTTYQSEAFLARTLDSIFAQKGRGTLFDLEVIVVDDCSRDGTADLCARYPLRFFSTSSNSGGPNRGRNIALEKASGEVICMIDHDDVWHEDKIAAMLPHLERVPIVSSGYTLIDGARGLTEERVSSDARGYRYFEPNRTFLDKMTRAKGGQLAYFSSLCYRAELKHIRFEEHFGAVDYDWVLRLFEGRDAIEVCRSLYTRHVEGGNLSLNSTFSARNFYYALLTLEEYATRYPTQVRLAYKRLHASRARYFYLLGDMPRARFHLGFAPWTLVNLLYFLTTYVGRDWVVKKFPVYG